MLFGLSQPHMAVAIIGTCITHASALSWALSKEAAMLTKEWPPRANEYTEMADAYHAIEMLVRNNTDGTAALQKNIFDEKMKTSTKILQNVGAGRADANYSETYGTLVAVTNAPKPAAVCLPQASSVPWLRLLLRMDGSEEWSDLHDRIVNKGVQASLTVVDTDIPEFLHERGDEFVKGVVVRDPVTRVLFSYLETCRSEGQWTECMSSKGRPLTFAEMVEKLDDMGTATAPDSLKLQVDACNLREQSFDVLGWHEDLEFTAEAFLRKVDKWSDFGGQGWGDLEDAKFSDTFPLDKTHEKVCDLYTPKLLRIVHRLYSVDFETFGYAIDKWSDMCKDQWAAAGEDEKGINTHIIPTPGKYVFPFYHHATKCTPTSEELHGMARGQETDFAKSSALKFFIHEEGAFDFNEVLDCFSDQYGMNASADDWDDHVFANISEHLGEVWLLKALQSHPQRTMDKTEADLHIIGALPFVSYMATQDPGNGKSCGTTEDHEQRMASVAHELQQLEGFRHTNGKNFFIFTTHFRLQDLYTDPLLKLLNEGNVMVGTADIDYTHWKNYPNIRRRIILPYKAHYLVEAGSFSEDRRGNRSTDVIFRGKIGRSNEGSSRQAMWDLMTVEGLNLDIQDVKFVNEKPSFSDELAEKYSHSRFCLAPAGDSPTSRRLFDALAAGCVPLALGDYDKLFRNLPFTRTIDWTKIVLYTGSLPCIGSDMETAKDWLAAITDRRNMEHSMRMAGVEVFQGALAYAGNGTGMVSALLTEIAHEM